MFLYQGTRSISLRTGGEEARFFFYRGQVRFREYVAEDVPDPVMAGGNVATASAGHGVVAEAIQGVAALRAGPGFLLRVEGGSDLPLDGRPEKLRLHPETRSIRDGVQPGASALQLARLALVEAMRAAGAAVGPGGFDGIEGAAQDVLGFRCGFQEREVDARDRGLGQQVPEAGLRTPSDRGPPVPCSGAVKRRPERMVTHWK